MVDIAERVNKLLKTHILIIMIDEKIKKIDHIASAKIVNLKK